MAILGLPHRSKDAGVGDWSSWSVRSMQSLRESVNLVVVLAERKREKLAPKFIEPRGPVRQVHGASLYANGLGCQPCLRTSLRMSRRAAALSRRG